MRRLWKRLFGRSEPVVTAASLNEQIRDRIAELAPEALEPEPPRVTKKPGTRRTPPLTVPSKEPAKRSTAKRAPAKRAPAKRSTAAAKKSTGAKKK